MTIPITREPSRRPPNHFLFFFSDSVSGVYSVLLLNFVFVLVVWLGSRVDIVIGIVIQIDVRRERRERRAILRKTKEGGLGHHRTRETVECAHQSSAS